MHLPRKLRYREVAGDVIETLLGMSLEPRLMPAAAVDGRRTVRSSASTPSLRSRDGTVPPHARTDPGGNVRVVVRVRAFLPRGTQVPVVSGERADVMLNRIRMQKSRGAPSAWSGWTR